MSYVANYIILQYVVGILGLEPRLTSRLLAQNQRCYHYTISQNLERLTGLEPALFLIGSQVPYQLGDSRKLYFSTLPLHCVLLKSIKTVSLVG